MIGERGQKKDPDQKKDPNQKEDPHRKKDPDQKKNPDQKKDPDQKEDPPIYAYLGLWLGPASAFWSQTNYSSVDQYQNSGSVILLPMVFSVTIRKFIIIMVTKYLKVLRVLTQYMLL